MTEHGEGSGRKTVKEALAGAGFEALDEVMKIESTDDARVENNPPQQGAKGDPMRIQYRVLTNWEKERMGGMKLAFEALHVFLDELGCSRELSIAKTKLEESCMWAVKHITR